MKDFITKVCFKINNGIGSVWSFVAGCLFVIVVYGFLPIQGFVHWNNGIGLFANSTESAVELVTGLGTLVVANALHNGHKKHAKAIEDLHEKVDKLGKKK